MLRLYTYELYGPDVLVANIVAAEKEKLVSSGPVDRNLLLAKSLTLMWRAPMKQTFDAVAS